MRPYRAVTGCTIKVHRKQRSLDLNQTLLEEIKGYKKNDGIYGVKFTTKDEMNEFYDDGIQIIDFIKEQQVLLH